VDFKNTLIIMTSNLGSEYLVKLGENQDVDEVRDDVMEVVKRAFRPEFLNRIDETILFHRLKRQHMGAIVDIQMQRLLKLLSERKISVSLSEAARNWLADKGYDPAYGARPLKRVIQKEVQDPLAEAILAGRVKDGDEVAVDTINGQIAINGLVQGSTPKPSNVVTLH
jgi:ATP-dependent Clp protease ATP-binding subunit ClpB